MRLNFCSPVIYISLLCVHGGSLLLWPVRYAPPQPFKKHLKHGFYPLLKLHPKHVICVTFDTLNRDFCSCDRFHTLNKEYSVISSVILYPKQGSLFSYPKQSKLIGKHLVPSPGHSGHTRKTEKSRFDAFFFHNKITYLFELPTLIAYLACQFCYPFFRFLYFWYPI